jgi:hypothetical protein
MDTNHHRLHILESQLISVIEAKEVDLTLGGSIAVERMSVPKSSDEAVLSYYIHPKIEGVIGGNVNITPSDDGVYVQAELSLRKFLKPQLSLSSAHVAVLLHHTKSLIQRVRVKTNEGEAISWKLDRVQRRIKVDQPVSLTLQSFVGLMRQISRIIEKVARLSLEVIQEEAEYYRAIGRWEYARRAYLTWHTVSLLDFEHLQNFLSVMQQVKDWRGCLNVLEESIGRYDEQTNAKLAYAASVLCRDVILDTNKAIQLIELAITLDPNNIHYDQLKSALVDAQHDKASEKQEGLSSRDHLNEDPSENDSKEKPMTHKPVIEDSDAFFDDLSLTLEDLKLVSDHEIVAEEIVAEEIVAEEIVSEEIVAEEIVAEEIVAEEIVAEEIVADQAEGESKPITDHSDQELESVLNDASAKSSQEKSKSTSRVKAKRKPNHKKRRARTNKKSKNKKGKKR